MNSEALTGRGAGGLRAAPRGPRRTDLGFRVICRGMPSPEEEEVEAGEVRRLLIPAIRVGRAETEKKKEEAAAAAASASAPRVGAGGAFIAGWGGRAETRRRGAR